MVTRDNGARRWNERTRWRERERRRRREPPRCRGNLFRKIRIGKIVAQLPKSLYHARVKNSLVRFAFVSKGQNHLLIGGVEKLLQGEGRTLSLRVEQVLSCREKGDEQRSGGHELAAARTTGPVAARAAMGKQRRRTRLHAQPARASGQKRDNLTLPVCSALGSQGRPIRRQT